MNKTNIPYKMYNIAVNDEDYQTLKTMGTVGDSFNDVVTGLIKIAKRKVEDRQDDKC
jgi:predicted CopG family antitoxin